MEREIPGLELSELPVLKKGVERKRRPPCLFAPEIMAALERDPEFRLRLLERVESGKDEG